jgi:hypothetical protein
MEANRTIMAVAFALIMIFFTWVMAIRTMNPLIQANLNTLDDKIAFYVDTLSSADEGRVEIPLERDTISNVQVKFETKGDKDGYEISSDGWYVIVAYRIGRNVVKSAGRIATYQGTEGFEYSVYSPESVCITKSQSEDYARLARC